MELDQNERKAKYSNKKLNSEFVLHFYFDFGGETPFFGERERKADLLVFWNLDGLVNENRVAIGIFLDAKCLCDDGDEEQGSILLTFVISYDFIPFRLVFVIVCEWCVCVCD